MFGLDYMVTCQSKLQRQDPFYLADGHKRHLRNVGYNKLSRYKARSLRVELEFSASVLTFDAKTENMTGIDTEPL
jgi:hypothetical protein